MPRVAGRGPAGICITATATATATATSGLGLGLGLGHGRARPTPRPPVVPPTSAPPSGSPALPGPTAIAVAITRSTSCTAGCGSAVAAVSATMRMPGGASRLAGWGRGRMVITAAGAWRSGAHGPGSNYDSTNGNGTVYSSWDSRRTVGAAAATAAAAAALDGTGSQGFGGGGGGIAGGRGGGGGGGDASFLERPTAEVRMSTVSERAAATCALGPEVAERMQADCIRAVRSWCKLGYGDHVVVHVEHQQLASTTNPGLLSAAAVTFNGPDGRRHSVIAVSVGALCAPAAAGAAAAAATGVATATASQQPPSPSRTSANAQFAGGGGGSAGDSGSAPLRRPPLAAHVAPGSAAPSLDPLPGLSLHWGCCHGLGQRWHAAASGWHTLPAVSYDAGKGAWQTPLAVRQAIPLDPDLSWAPAAGDGSSSGQWVAVYSLVLQLPWEGPIRNGGLCFVLKTARNQWLKARTLPRNAFASGGGSSSSSNGGSSGGGGGGEVDFWIPTSALPVVANGVPLLPDVFRMSHSDSLPQVATVQQQATTVLEPLSDNNSNTDGHSNGNDNGNGGTVAAVPLAANTTSTSTAPHTPAEQSPSPSPSPSPPSAALPAQPQELDLLGMAAVFRPPPHLSDVLLRPAERHPLPPPHSDGGWAGGAGRPLGLCHWMLDHIVQREPSAERSLMHRYLAGADLVDMVGGSSEAAEALAAVTAWIRFSSARLLVWNRNYNVKPREISTAQARLAAALAALGATRGPAAPGGRGSAAVGALVRVALAAVGRGGAGEVGQRIRDEILAIQQRNGCKGGMMEEWHQKLHNNTSPDDVIICKALLDYIAAGLDITVYWRTLTSAGITAQRLASFDRPITSEPRFGGQQAAGLQADLTAYMQTLQAVHGGDDLSSAVNNVLGYEETDMKGKRIVVPPVPNVATPTLERHLRALLALQRHLASPAAVAAAAAAASTAQHHSPTSAATSRVNDMSSPVAPAFRTSVVQPPAPGAGAGATSPAHRPTDVASLYGLPGALRLMEMVVEARHQIRPFLDGGDTACSGRLVDVAFLDLALDTTLRTAVEANIGPIKRAIADGTGIYIAAAAAAATAVGSNGDAAAVRPGGGGSGGGGSRPLAGAFAAAAALSQALEVVRLTTENAALSCCPNDDLVYSNKWLRLLVAQEDPRDARDRMLQGLAISERLKRYLADQGAAIMGLIQPAADALAERLKLPPEAVKGVGEEVVRGSSGTPLAQLLSSLEPALRQATGGGVWQIVSRGSDRPVLAGRLRVEARLAAVQHEVMREPTVLLVEGITGAEEIPEGCVAVLVGGGASGGGCPDVLSHSAVRARNMGVLLAGCHSPEMVTRIKSHAGSRVMVRLEGADVQISFSSTGAASAAAAAATG